MNKQLLIFPLLASCLILYGQPVPGELFREYAWYNVAGDCNGALRVGGRLDYRLTGTAEPYMGNGLIAPGFDLELGSAVRAELVIEKMLCHGGTEGLRVSINGHQPVRLPEAEHIPEPQPDYAHHYNAVVPVDLSFLDEGPGNTFLFEVDTAGHWWPQNLVYGMILRVYYNSGLPGPRGVITRPGEGDILGEVNQITFQPGPGEKIRKIDFVGYYEDADLEGDGIFRQWHYAYHKCEIYNHIGSVSGPSNSCQWNTEWLPDQHEPVKLAAFVHRSDGYIYMTEAVGDLTLTRPGVSVELCKPYRRPKGWFTRNGVFEERFRIKGDLETMTEAKLVFRSWSPGYLNGIYVNDFIVLINEGPKYDYFQHAIPVDRHVLKAGENILRTGLTPLYPEGMVHGTEIQWPGIMLLVRYGEHTNE